MNFSIRRTRLAEPSFCDSCVRKAAIAVSAFEAVSLLMLPILSATARAFSCQVGRTYAALWPQDLHTKQFANHDNRTESANPSKLRTSSHAHALHEANRERAFSHRTSPIVAAEMQGRPRGAGSLGKSNSSRCEMASRTALYATCSVALRNCCGSRLLIAVE